MIMSEEDMGSEYQNISYFLIKQFTLIFIMLYIWFVNNCKLHHIMDYPYPLLENVVYR